MNDEPTASLRLALIVLGLVVVTGVYLWSSWLRRRERNRRYGRRLRDRRAPRRGDFEDDESADFEANPPPGVVGASAAHPHLPTDDFEITVLPPRERVVELPVLSNEAATSAPSVDTPQAQDEQEPIRHAPEPPRGKGRRKRDDQLSFGFEETPTEPPTPEVLALYLRPASSDAFEGLLLEQALAAVGMRFGERNIYHHFGTGELSCKRPLFSLANMFEPGEFDPDNMAGFSTAGVALFIQFPSELDGPVAFELFLNAAQRLSEHLKADLLGEPRKPLDSAAIERMRRIAARFPNAR